MRRTWVRVIELEFNSRGEQQIAWLAALSYTKPECVAVHGALNSDRMGAYGSAL